MPLHSFPLGPPKRTHPLWTVSRRTHRQIEGWKLVAWLLFVSWWFVPLVIVVWTFWTAAKIIVWLVSWIALEVNNARTH